MAAGRSPTQHRNHLASLSEKEYDQLQLYAMNHCTLDVFAPEWQPKIPPPREPVFAEQYHPLGSPVHLPRFLEAEELMWRREYERAESLVTKVLREYPNNGEARCLHAANLARMKRPDDALKEFEKLAESGFAEYPTARRLHMGMLAASPRYRRALAKIRDTFARNPPPTSVPCVFVPEGDPPATGFPSLVVLQSTGDSHENYFREAKDWADLGFVVVALPGSLPVRQGKFKWSTDNAEHTHSQVQMALNSSLVRPMIDSKRSFLSGFGQGAMHAFFLLASHPEEYAGAVSISPGGRRPWPFKDGARLRFSPRLRLLVTWGDGDRPDDQERGRTIVDMARAAHWPTEVIEHSARHNYPPEWALQRSPAADYLLGRTASTRRPQ